MSLNVIAATDPTAMSCEVSRRIFQLMWAYLGKLTAEKALVCPAFIGILLLVTCLSTGAGASTYDHYNLSCGPMTVNASVITEMVTGAPIKCVTKITGHVFSQSLHLPHDITIVDRADYGPEIILYRPDKSYILEVLQYVGDGVMDDRQLSFYRWDRDRWRAIYIPHAVQYNCMFFSGHGGTMNIGKNVYVWDFIFDDRFALFAPAKFELWKFTWKHNRLVDLKKYITKRKYDLSVLSVYYPPPTNPSSDPLREFGLRWPSNHDR